MKIKKLKEKGFIAGRIIETIFLTKSQDKINHTPIGIKKSSKESLKAKIYKKTNTYYNLLENSSFSVNLTNDAEIFFKSIFDKELEINEFELKNSFLTIKGELKGLIDEENYIISKLGIQEINEKEKPQKGYCRANSAIIEALIHYTKIPFKDKEKQKKEIKKATEVVRKTGSKKEIDIIEKLNQRI